MHVQRPEIVYLDHEYAYNTLQLIRAVRRSPLALLGPQWLLKERPFIDCSTIDPKSSAGVANATLVVLVSGSP